MMMSILDRLAVAIVALTLFTIVPLVHAATAAGAGIELNGKYVGGYTITRNGESREDLVRQLSKRPITFERDFKIPVDAKDPTLATLKGTIRLLSKIRGDRQAMATTKALQLVKRGGRWYAEPESLKRALKDIALIEEMEHAGWPAGTVMAADKSNATHRLTLTFSVDGHTGDQKHEYLFRVLDKPSNRVMSLPASGSHSDGRAGGYGLYVMPDPLSVFENNRVSFKITFEGKRNDKGTSVKESIEVPLLEEDSGQVGLIKYKTKWKAYQGDADRPATAERSEAEGKGQEPVRGFDEEEARAAAVAHALFEEWRVAGSLPDGVVVRVLAELGRTADLNEKVRADAVAHGLKFEKTFTETWEFTANHVHRIDKEFDGRKPVYRRVESRPLDSKGVCQALADGKALEIRAGRGEGKPTLFAGTNFTLGVRSLEVLRNGERVFYFGENCAFAGCAESKAKAFAALYENLAGKARGAFERKPDPADE